MKIVTVSVEALRAPLAPIRYAVMLNKTPRQIAAWRKRKGNEKIFVLPFFTGRPEDCPDYSRMRSGHVMRPCAVGNLSPMKSAIAQIVFHVTGGSAECVLDESVGL
jgi:hypothetical protein